jgi:hypothetical protein
VLLRVFYTLSKRRFAISFSVKVLEITKKKVNKHLSSIILGTATT